MTRKSKGSLEFRVLQYIRDNRLFEGINKLLLAVSGGPDSVCLLLVMMKLSNELGINLHIAHLNHKLRGEDSDNDAEYVLKLGQKLDLPVIIDERDVREYRRKHGGTLEETARDIRYDFLAKTANSVEANAVAVGHTRDDNIETILMHLIRGTGTRGLRGLQPATQHTSSTGTVKVLRPLLEIHRIETQEYCRVNGYEPRLDSSNESLTPLRNRIRHQFIPLLESYNEQIGEALLRDSRIAADELEFFNITTGELWGTIANKHKNTVVINKKGLQSLHPALKRHLLRESIEKIAGNLKDIEVRHIEAILDALDLQAGKQITLPAGVIFIVEYDRFLLTREVSSLSPFPVLDNEYIVEIPGMTEFPGWNVKADIISIEQVKNTENKYLAYFDYEKVGNELLVRPRRTADSFYPLGMDQPKKVGEFMIDTKIPRNWRKMVPVVCSPQQIIWITGYRIDDRVKVTDDTTQVLRLEFVRNTDS